MLRATKLLQFQNHEHGFDVRCRLGLALKESKTHAPVLEGPMQFTVGLEIVINFLAPNMPDRYIEGAEGRKNLEWSGVIDEPRVRLVDEWQNVAAKLDACGASQFWVSPIETVSESEEGFERVYQGSQILAVWNVTLDPGQYWSAEMVLHVSSARSAK
jgi:alpha-amylase